MDTAGCHWQDILLEHYFQASHITVWPLPGQVLHNPLWLESVTRIMNDLDTVITLLQRGWKQYPENVPRNLENGYKLYCSSCSIYNIML